MKKIDNKNGGLMEFECPECGRIFATAGTCPDDYLELTQLIDDDEEAPKPFYPQEEYKPFDEEEDGESENEPEGDKKYEEA